MVSQCEMRQGLFVMIHAPGKHFLCVFQNQAQVVWVVCLVYELVRVLLQVKEQRWQIRKVHVLIAIIAEYVQAALVLGESE